MDGVLVIDKPAGMTSHDVVNRCRRLTRQKRIGHTGTLDPMATGVMVLCLGAATRVAEYLAASDKEYRAEIVLGVTTTTEDTSGQVLAEADASAVSLDDVRTAAQRLTGSIKQVPPMASAVHHEGRRLYELARQGITVDRAPRDVTVHQLDVCAFVPGEKATVSLFIRCSPGTYIRTIAADMGVLLNVGGAMSALRRTRSGRFGIESATTLDGLAQETELAQEPMGLVSIGDALSEWQRATLGETEAADIAFGRSVATVAGVYTSEAPVLATDQDGRALAICRADGARLHPVKVFA